MISRRVFVRNAVIVSAGTWAAALGIVEVGGLVRRRLFPRRLPGPVLSWLSSFENGAMAGEAVGLRARRRQELVESVELILDGVGADVGQLEAATRDRIEADFADGRVVIVDGWILSETEVGVFLIQKGIGEGLYRPV